MGDDNLHRAMLDDRDRADGAEPPEAPAGDGRPAPFEARQPGEPVQLYGARVLQYLIRTETTAILSDEDLALADHAATYAVAAREISPAALDRISRARHLATRAIAWRKADTASAGPSQYTVPSVPVPDSPGPDGGARVPAQPRPPTRPPAGLAVDIRF